VLLGLVLLVQSGEAQAKGLFPADLKSTVVIEHFETESQRDGYQFCAQMIVYGWPTLRGKVHAVRVLVNELTKDGYCFYHNSGGALGRIDSYWFQCAVITWPGGVQLNDDQKDVMCAEELMEDYAGFRAWLEQHQNAISRRQT